MKICQRTIPFLTMSSAVCLALHAQMFPADPEQEQKVKKVLTELFGQPKSDSGIPLLPSNATQPEPLVQSNTTFAPARATSSSAQLTNRPAPLLDAKSQAPFPDYTVQGALKVKTIRYSDKKGYYYDDINYGFEIFVDGCKWLIKLGTRDPELYDSRIVSSDGQDSFLLLNYETRQRINLAKGIPTVNIGDGCARKANFPCFIDANEAGTVWLAYASACYLDQHFREESLPVPYCDYVRWFAIDLGENAVFQRAHLSLCDSPPYLPEAMAYYFHPIMAKDEKFWEQSSETNAGGVFTNVIYKTLSFTNFDGVSIPKEAASWRYIPEVKSLPRLVPQLCEEIHLTTTNIIRGVLVRSFKPKLPGYTTIADYRFDPKGSMVHATNDWPSEAEEAEQLRACSLQESSKVKLSQPAPLFSLLDLSSNKVSLSDYRGRKVVLLDFWATWCGSCQEAMPGLKTLQDKFKSQGLEILSVDQAEPADRVGQFISRKNYGFHVVLDSNLSVSEKYGVRFIPTLVLVDKSGVVQWLQVGYNKDESELQKTIERLIKQ